jgi:hypothetical protein
MTEMSRKQISHPASRTEQIVVEQVGLETVVYDMDTNVGHALKSLAAAVFMYADGKNSIDDIAELCAYRLGAPVTPSEVEDAVAQLHDASLLEAPVLDIKTGVSRRAALKTFAAAGVGTMLVTSVATSAASACTTCNSAPANTGGSCVSGRGVGQDGAGGCTICKSSGDCGGSTHACCCAPCDDVSDCNGTTKSGCCQPICFTSSTCPSGTLPLTTVAGDIKCPTGYAQYTGYGNYLAKCCQWKSTYCTNINTANNTCN